MDELTGRKMPWAPEAEQAVIGSCLIDPHCISEILAVLHSEDFYLDQTLLGLDYGPDELAALVEDVSAGEVAKAAGDIALDAAYFLRGEEKA